MLDSIQNFYNNLPASFWEYKELFINSRYSGLYFFILFLIIIFFIFKNYRDNKKLKEIIANIPQLQINQDLINKVKNHDEKFFDLEIINKATDAQFKELNQKLKEMYRNETVEYNPYQDSGVGGKQSFSTAFINKNGDGIILTSLYARDRTRFLLKKINNFVSEKELAPEEKEVLAKFKK